MERLSYDQINFVKRKIQQFITLPASPQKTLTQKNKQGHQSPRSPIRKQTQVNSRHNRNVGTNKNKQDNNSRLKKIQSDILQFITKQNRDKQSVLNKFLNSDKINLKKRQDVQQNLSQIQKLIQNKNQVPLQQNPTPKSFVFHNSFSELKNIYKNNLGQHPKTKEGDKYQQQHCHDNNSHLFDFSKNTQSTKSVEFKQNKHTFEIQSETSLIKPSELKGKFPTNQVIQKSKQKNLHNQSTKISIILKKEQHGSGQLELGKQLSKENFIKSSSQVSFQKRNNSPSFSNAKRKQSQKIYKQKSVLKLNDNSIKKIKNTDIKKDMQSFFDNQNNSIFRQDSFLMKLKKIQSSQYSSPIKKEVLTNDNGFSPSVYKKSFKKSPYELGSQHKFLINKYWPKQLSPNEKQELKDKYKLLEKRLDKILQNVKMQKSNHNKQFTDQGKQVDSSVENQKTQIPQEVLIYHKLSPLKKLIKINKQLRLKVDGDI